MEYIFLVGLGCSTLCVPAEGSAESREVVFGLNGPSFEERNRAWELVAAPGFSLGAPERSFREAVWRPSPCLQYEDEGVPGSQRLTSLLLLPGRTSPDEADGWRLPGGSTAEAFSWRESALPGRSAIWFLLNSVDALVGWDNIHVSVGKGVSAVSVSTTLTTLLESLGTPLDRGIFLGINLDLLGIDEADGARLAMIDSHHGTARVSYLSTGLGLTVKF